jgi:hypothetical protein
MYILTLKGKEDEGAYAVESERGDKILYLFLDKDDAIRYAGLLEADDFPEMSVVEVDEISAMRACESFDFSYCVITPEEIIIPPRENSPDLPT